MPYLVIPIRCFHLAGNDRVGVTQNAKPLRGDFPENAHGQSRTGKRLSLHDLLGQSELSSDFALEGGRETNRLSREIEEGVYRLVQECLANVTKHADASHVEISVRESAESVDVVVRDDGRGFDTAVPSEGFGLVGMRERVALAGGSMTIETAPGAGTVVRLSLPVARLEALDIAAAAP